MKNVNINVMIVEVEFINIIRGFNLIKAKNIIANVRVGSKVRINETKS